MSLVSVTRGLLAEKLFEAKFDDIKLPVNTAGQIIRALVLAVFAAFCFGQMMKPQAAHLSASHPAIAAAKWSAR